MQRFVFTAWLALLTSVAFAAETDKLASVVTAADVTLSEAELQYVVSHSPVSVQRDISRSADDRVAFINALIVSKRIAAEVDAMTANAQGEDYWAKEFALLGAKREFAQKLFQQQLVIPDLEPLARERYAISKQEIASVPESRSVSHILLLCQDDCDADSKRQALTDIRARALAGESFADLAKAFTEDVASRDKGGRLKTPIIEDNARLDESFRLATFALTTPGEVSEVFQSRVGFHIVRLESIEPARIRSYEEVKDQLIPEIERRYRTEALSLYLDQFQPKGDLELDYSRINSLLGLDPAMSWDAE